MSDFFNILDGGPSVVSVVNDSVHAVRTTVLATTTAFVDVDLDTTDIETDSAVISHGTPDPTDRIILKAAGTYLCSIHADSEAPTVTNSTAEVQLRVRKNDSIVLAGSQIQTSVLNDNSIVGNIFSGHTAGSFEFAANANDFITLQTQHVVIGGSPDPVLKANLVGMTVVRLTP